MIANEQTSGALLQMFLLLFHLMNLVVIQLRGEGKRPVRSSPRGVVTTCWVLCLVGIFVLGAVDMDYNEDSQERWDFYSPALLVSFWVAFSVGWLDLVIPGISLAERPQHPELVAGRSFRMRLGLYFGYVVTLAVLGLGMAQGRFTLVLFTLAVGLVFQFRHSMRGPNPSASNIPQWLRWIRLASVTFMIGLVILALGSPEEVIASLLTAKWVSFTLWLGVSIAGINIAFDLPHRFPASGNASPFQRPLI